MVRPFLCLHPQAVTLIQQSRKDRDCGWAKLCFVIHSTPTCHREFKRRDQTSKDLKHRECRVMNSLDEEAQQVLKASAGDELLCQSARVHIAIARSDRRIAQALALRARVFREACESRVHHQSIGDDDLFDPWCIHLVAIDPVRDDVVGTYRILTPESARELGCRYAEQEFWLTRLDPLRHEIVELGRACVDPQYRGGTILMLMWSGLSRWLSGQHYTHLMGCVSVSLKDGPDAVLRLYEQLMPSHDAGESFRVWPLQRLTRVPKRVDGDAAQEVEVPALLRAYLKAGAMIMGEPCVDHELGCADFPVILPLEQLDHRFRQRFGPLAA
ncbi:MAG: GNAT family N-acetyltransferase [Betaproteobacteria bacterium]|nr:GNAT family N-acetyltransferase [Betaproteobacteria bacterium]